MGSQHILRRGGCYRFDILVAFSKGTPKTSEENSQRVEMSWASRKATRMLCISWRDVGNVSMIKSAAKRTKRDDKERTNKEVTMTKYSGHNPHPLLRKSQP